MTEQLPTVLIVDDSAEDRSTYRQYLEATYAIAEAAIGAQALALCRTLRPACLLLDYRLPDGDGLQWFARLREDAVAPPVILLTGAGSEALAAEALKRGVQDYLVKQQLTPELLRRAVRQAMEAAAVQQTLTAQQQELERLAAAVQQTNTAVMITTAELDTPGPQIVYVNPAFTGMTGYTAAELLGRTPRLLQGPGTDRTELNRLRRALEQGRPFDGEVINYRKDGTAFMLEWHVTPVRNARGVVTHFVSTQNDLTARRQMEAQLRESEERFRWLANAIPQLVWTANADGVVDYYNRRVSEYSEAVRIPEGAWRWEPLLHPDDLAPTFEAWQQAAQRGQPYEWAHRLRMADGSFRWHLSRALPRRGEAGEVVQWFGTATDIHDMHQAEAALRESEQRLSLALEAAAMGVWVWELRTQRVTWSPEQYRLFGVEAFDGTPEGFGRFLHPEDADRVWAMVTGAIRDHALYEAEFRIIRGDGAVRWIGNRGRAEYDANGDPVRMLGIAMDITPRKQAEEALRSLTATLEQRVAERTAALAQAMAAQQRLEREARRAEHFSMLGRLAAGVSHEIRNPLAAVFLNVDLLAAEFQQPSPDSAAQIAESLAEVQTHLRRLEDLVQDYLSLVRVGAIERTDQDLGLAMQDWGSELRALAAERGVTFREEGLATLGRAAIHANTLRRAVLNLVQNALDAVAPGGTVSLSGAGTADQAELRVCDTGHGIPAERLQQIFEPLYTTKPGGTGLGLYIVQQIVTAHGGQLAVESSEGQGTTFTITLPRQAAAPGAAPPG